ncbi:hypothetical protein [Bacillus sp. RAR_GA_16]|uniref:hypothetical protein n=1 Tax=Bacillus sp. RAR_GA_16 TaxID=2876774 RepID=UPI001CCA2349|nr:hypothetical protein [Bacillus sp. RAR_GA_16]MCA0171446.1 hypothetical protein [Bacillus sp. RAR_GA_16]
MDKQLKNLRAKMTDTKAVTFTPTHKNEVWKAVNRGASSNINDRFGKGLHQKAPALLTYFTLLILLVGTVFFAASESGILPANQSAHVHPLTEEELYNNLWESASLTNPSDEEKIRSIALSYLANYDNWKISNTESYYQEQPAILAQGKITEGYFEKMTFSIWIDPETGLPLNFVIRNQQSSILEEFSLPNEAIAKVEQQK